MPSLHQRARDVRAAGGFAIGQGENRFNFERNVQCIDARNHLPNAVLADGLELGNFHQQRFILHVEKIAEEMNLGVFMLGGEFRAGDELNARRVASRRHARATLDRIVVRQRHRREAQPLAMPGQFLRRKRAIRKIRMQM